VEEWSVYHDTLRPVSVDECVEEFVYPWIDDRFVTGKQGRVRKKQAAEGTPVDGGVGGKQGKTLPACCIGERRDYGILYVDQCLMRHPVGVHDGKAPFFENFGRAVFAGAHGAGQSYHETCGSACRSRGACRRSDCRPRRAANITHQ